MGITEVTRAVAAQGHCGLGNQKSNRWKGREYVTRQFGVRNGKEKYAESCPTNQKPTDVTHVVPANGHLQPTGRRPEKQSNPRQERYQQNRNVEPEWLDVLKFGREIAFEIMFDDKDAKEARIAPRARNIPGQGGGAEREDCCWMQKPKYVAPAFCENCPEENRTAGENDRRWTLG